MKGLSLLAVIAGLAVSGTEAIQLVSRDGTPRVVGMDLERKAAYNPVERDRARMRKRQSKTVSETLDNAVRIAQYDHPE